MGARTDKPCFLFGAGVQDDGKLVGLAPREQEISAAVLAGMAAEVGAASQLLQQLPVGQGRAALYMRVRRASVDHLLCTDFCVAGMLHAIGFTLSFTSSYHLSYSFHLCTEMVFDS